MRSCLLLVACILTAAAAPGQMFARFETSPFVTPPEGPVFAALDADGDGAVDLLVSNSTTGAIDFYRNEGPHKFVLRHSSTWLSPIVSFGGGGAATGDIDGDGDIDVLAGDILENLGGGAFQPHAVSLAPTSGLSVELFDMEGDGDLDILQVGRLFRNDGNWTFTDVTASNVPGQPNFLLVSTATLIDADHDGDMDIALGVFLTAEVFLFRNDGLGFFTGEFVANLFPLFFRLHAVDLNADGFDDLAAMAHGPSYALQNDGTGAFTSAPRELGDDLDGVFVNQYSNGDLEFVGTSGAWHITPHQAERKAYPPEIVTPATPLVADLDGDLDLDVVIGPQATVLTSIGGLVSASPARIAQPFHVLEGRIGSVVNGAYPELMFATWNPGALRVHANVGGQYRLRPVPFVGPEPAGVSDVAIVARTDQFGFPAFGLQLAVCTPTGPIYYRQNGNLQPEIPSPLPPLGTPTHVAAGDLDQSFGDDLVFGDPAVDGPRILMQSMTAFVEQSPRLAAPTPVSVPAYESVLLADMDGDGDQDIVHELRVLHNDGGGQWSVAGAITATLAPSIARFHAIDFDNDGDRDLLAVGPSVLQLLENDNGAFTDATFGHIPIAGWNLDVAGVADVDRDGDTDVLASGGWFLRNDNGTFAMIQSSNIGTGRAAALDVNYDGNEDVITFDGVFENTHTHLRAIRRAALGGDWELEVNTWREVALPQLAFLAIATPDPQSTPVYAPIGPMGALQVKLTEAAVVPIVLVAGTGRYTLSIPATPLVLGTSLKAQALVVGERALLTGAVQDQVW